MLVNTISGPRDICADYGWSAAVICGPDEPVMAAAARTVAAEPARLFAAWSPGSPVPDEADRRCEGIADFAARRARVWQVPMFTARVVPAGVTVPAGPYRALTQIPAEVWLDSAGRSRRIAVLSEPASGDRQLPIWSVLELRDFGVPADIVPPGPADVA
jgi:hypothetical protein